MVIITEKLIAGLASIPERHDALEDTVNSILPQVDELNIFLNGYEYIPKFCIHPKIKVHRSQLHGNKGDAGKFFSVGNHPNCYFFTLDDDIIYPKDYIEKLKAKIDEYDRKNVVSFHGAYIKKPIIETYWGGRFCFSCLQHQAMDEHVHIGGTGVMGFHTSAVKVNFTDFELPNMADIWMYKLCQQQKVGIICAQHEAGWIVVNPKVDPLKTIWERNKHNDKRQVAVINSFPDRKFYSSMCSKS